MMMPFSFLLIAGIFAAALGRFSRNLLRPFSRTSESKEPTLPRPTLHPEATKIITPALHRSLITDWLPDAQKLMDLSIREVEQLRDQFRAEILEVGQRLQTDSGAADGTRLDELRQAMVALTTRYREQQLAATTRVSLRHHPQGRFGQLVTSLCAVITSQVEQSRLFHQQLSELAAELDPQRVYAGLTAILAGVQMLDRELSAGLGAVRQSLEVLRIEMMCTSWFEAESFGPSYASDCLAKMLAHAWTISLDEEGPVTVALIDINHIQVVFPGLDQTCATRTLYSIAHLITGSDSSSSDRAVVELDTKVVDRQGRPRTILWTCTLVERPDGGPVSIIATGRERNVSKDLKTVGDSSEKLADSGALSAAGERRRRPRAPFPYVQLVAPAVGESLPPIAEFYEVLCHDISTGGISFFTSAMPSTSLVVIALGTKPPHIYMRARLVHYKRQDTDGEPKYLLGCQFIGRTLLFAHDQGMFVFNGKSALL